MTLEDFNEYVRGKDIILVGNDLNALTVENGNYINEHDVVLRFGKGIPNDKTGKYIGDYTDIWVTGQLRQATVTSIPKDTKILFNNSLYSKKFGRLKEDHLQMYTEEEICALAEDYGIQEGRRLSAGCVTSHWLANRVSGWKSLTWVNFDCFRNWFVYHDDGAGKDSIATSWHIPLLRQDYVGWRPSEGDQHPAHDPEVEQRIYKDLLTFPNTYWKGTFEDKSKFIPTPRVVWTHGRSEATEE